MGIGQPDSVAKYGIGESVGRSGEVVEDDYGISVKAERLELTTLCTFCLIRIDSPIHTYLLAIAFPSAALSILSPELTLLSLQVDQVE